MVPKVSVIIPVFNAERFLPECLDSILGQSFKDLEIILVNDGSTDGSWKIIKDYCQKYQNITAIKQKNLGVKKARINGYRKARGEYISWIDNDDATSSEMYDLMYSSAKDANADLVVCNYDFYPKKVSTKQKWFKSYCGKVDWYFVSHNTLLWNKLFKKAFLDQIDFIGYMDKLSEASFVMPLLHARLIVTIDEPLYKYRVGHGGQSSMKNVQWYKDNYRLSLARERTIHHSQFKDQWTDYFQYLTSFSIIQLLIVAAYNGQKEDYRYYQYELRQSHKLSNEMFKKAIEKEYGLLKYLVFRWVVPHSFWLTRQVARRVS